MCVSRQTGDVAVTLPCSGVRASGERGAGAHTRSAERDGHGQGALLHGARGHLGPTGRIRGDGGRGGRGPFLG